ncbi:MAG TPA: hypothetical protein PLU37_04815 [Chitinophagaceae bacterium]|nr:hypothetical protein [Chitinophagaceae bacterium]MCB9055145.1 hypothetical protein [Chitinophagales bacterium]HPG10829.1 hypothetical protein [Chitinophagaceae bacterium]
MKFLGVYIALCIVNFKTHAQPEQSIFSFEVIYMDGLLMPDSSMQENSISFVRDEKILPIENKRIITEKYFDKNGYLLKMINIDSSLLYGKEIINVLRSLDGSINVTWIISHDDFIRVNEEHIDIFWRKYFFYKDSLKTKEQKEMVVSSYLKWTIDSSIHYKTFFNDKPIDSGVERTIFTKYDPSEMAKCNTEVKEINANALDSTITCIYDSIKESFSRNIFSFNKGMLKKRVWEYYKEGKLEIENSTSYYYDDLNRISTEVSEDFSGRVYQRKKYQYSFKDNYEYIVEKYPVASNDTVIEKYDKYDRVLEKSKQVFWRGSFKQLKVKYIYNEDGLVNIIKTHHGDTLILEQKKEYKKF